MAKETEREEIKEETHELELAVCELQPIKMGGFFCYHCHKKTYYQEFYNTIKYESKHQRTEQVSFSSQEQGCIPTSSLFAQNQDL